MDRWTTACLVGVIPNLPAAGVVVPSLLVVLRVLPNPKSAVMWVAPAVVVRIPGMVMAPIPQG
jgi:hypothetical protein